MGNFHVVIVGNIGKLIRRKAVRFYGNKIIEFFEIYFVVAAYRVIPGN